MSNLVPILGVNRHRLLIDGEGVTTLVAFQVLGNLRWLIEHGKAEQITVRIPLIPQYNMEEDTTHSIDLLKSMGLSHFDVFTYRT